MLDNLPNNRLARTLIANNEKFSILRSMLGLEPHAQVSSFEIELLMNSPHSTIVKEIMGTNIATEEIARWHKELVAQQHGQEILLQSELAKHYKKERSEAQEEKANMTRRQLQEAATKNNAAVLKELETDFHSHLSTLESEYSQVQVELTSAQSNLDTLTDQLESMILNHQAEFIALVHQNGGRFSHQQAAHILNLPDTHFEQLPEFEDLLGPNAAGEVTPTQAINRCGEMLGDNFTPTLMLALNNIMRTIGAEQAMHIVQQCREEEGNLHEQIGQAVKSVEQLASKATNLLHQMNPYIQGISDVREMLADKTQGPDMGPSVDLDEVSPDSNPGNN